MPAAAATLVERCATLRQATLPRRLAGREAALKVAFSALCAATAELQTVAVSKDKIKIEAAVESLHTAYQAAEHACE
jgi:hypothetical protein